VWYHIAFTYSASTKTGKYYVNGGEISSTVIAGGNIDAGGNTVIGAGEGYYENGLIDEVRIYTAASRPTKSAPSTAPRNEISLISVYFLRSRAFRWKWK
jgi:hypothetical protein